MLASTRRSSDHTSGGEYAYINGSPPGQPDMTTQTLINGWNEEETNSKMESIPAKSSRIKNVSRPPPIDIAIARAARQDFLQDGDEEEEGCSSADDKTCEDEMTSDEVWSPDSQISSQYLTSPPLTSPTSVSSDTPDGGILRRKSSIKGVSKTPETPGGKSVRFADALGLDLEIVRDILESESPPDYPSMAAAACAAARAAGSEGASKAVTLALQPRYLTMSFVQPGGQPDFLTRVNQQSVCLENAVLSDFTVLGTIKVQNLSFHKRVKVRYSADGWRSFGDIPASYVQNSCDGPTDRFSFGLSAPRDMTVGARLEFCICYTAGTRNYWDNNFGKNYALVCHSQGDVIDVENTLLWTHFM